MQRHGAQKVTPIKPSSLPETQPHRNSTYLGVVLGILLATAISVVIIVTNRPEPVKRPLKRTAALVQVITAVRATHTVMVPAMGTVIPAREMVLRPLVGGEIVSVNPRFVIGGYLNAGDEVLKIDTTDFQLAVTRKQFKVAEAVYQLKLEMGRQAVAQREWDLLNRNAPAMAEDADLALRKPHLEKARAMLDAARAELAQEKINLTRTTIRVPFNAVVRTKNVDLGSRVSVQDQLATLVGTDEYWIQVSVPTDRLAWIVFPNGKGRSGSPGRIFSGTADNDTTARIGQVLKLLSDLDTKGRMARVLVSVRDPLGLATGEDKHPPLLIGAYVRVEIEGCELNDVFRIPRHALRDDAAVWIAAPDNTLVFRTVDIVWRDQDTVYIQNGIVSGDRIIVTDLSTPVESMPVLIDG